MSFCSYVIKTPMSQIREDWNEFMSLVQKGRFLDNECKYVGKKLYINKSEPYGCIVRVEPQVKGGAQVKYCENFFKTHTVIDVIGYSYIKYPMGIENKIK